MKSLIRKPKKESSQDEAERKTKRKSVDAKKIAQCCAKVSKSVAGCHD